VNANLSRDILGDFTTLAESMIESHIEEDEGEQCFNLCVYLEELGERIGELIDANEGWGREVGTFKLDAHEIARFLWVCIAIKSEGMAYPDKFRGMPVLD
jgi:hypothetical protein